MPCPLDRDKLHRSSPSIIIHRLVHSIRNNRISGPRNQPNRKVELADKLDGGLVLAVCKEAGTRCGVAEDGAEGGAAVV